MLRFGKLVYNEYIKIFVKKSTLIFTAIALLVPIALNAIIIYQFNYDYGSTYSYQESYDEQIAYQKNEKPEGYLLEIEMLTMLKEKDINYDDWRYKAIESMFTLKKALAAEGNADTDGSMLDRHIEASATLSDAEKAILNRNISSINTAVSNKDHKAYYSAMIDYWENTTLHDKKISAISAEKYKMLKDKDIKNVYPDAMFQVAEDIERFRLERLGFDNEEKQNSPEAKLLDEAIAIRKYQFDNEIPNAPLNETDRLYNLPGEKGWSYYQNLTNGLLIIMVLSMLIVIIAGSSVSSEYSNGTIKFLLINPYRRSKILWSKYAAIITLSVALILVYFLANALYSCFFASFKNVTDPFLTYNGTKVVETPVLLQGLKAYFLAAPEILVTATLAFAISCLLKNSAISIGVGMMALLSGSGAVAILKEAFNIDWARYIVFANTNLGKIISGQSNFYNHTLSFALTVIAVYLIVFLFIAYDGFVRTDVK